MRVQTVLSPNLTKSFSCSTVWTQLAYLFKWRTAIIISIIPNGTDYIFPRKLSGDQRFIEDFLLSYLVPDQAEQTKSLRGRMTICNTLTVWGAGTQFRKTFLLLYSKYTIGTHLESNASVFQEKNFRASTVVIFRVHFLWTITYSRINRSNHFCDHHRP